MEILGLELFLCAAPSILKPFGACPLRSKSGQSGAEFGIMPQGGPLSAGERVLCATNWREHWVFKGLIDNRRGLD
jgi:hypothetical protein